MELARITRASPNDFACAPCEVLDEFASSPREAYAATSSVAFRPSRNELDGYDAGAHDVIGGMCPSSPMIPLRDTVVIGCSAGGTVALPQLLGSLPANMRAAVLIVQHMAATSPSYLVEILRRRSHLDVQWAEHGTRLEHGRVLVAPPRCTPRAPSRRSAALAGPSRKFWETLDR